LIHHQGRNPLIVNEHPNAVPYRAIGQSHGASGKYPATTFSLRNAYSLMEIHHPADPAVRGDKAIGWRWPLVSAVTGSGLREGRA
jgi:hypothetical protein